MNSSYRRMVTRRDIAWLCFVLLLIVKDSLNVVFTYPTILYQDLSDSPSLGTDIFANNDHIKTRMIETSFFDYNDETMHILLSLSGNHTGFFEEVEVLLKSVLMNAPRDRPMKIHMMADQRAFSFIPELIWSKNNSTKAFHSNLSLWRSGQPVMIQTYNVDAHIVDWERRIKQLYRRNNLSNRDARRDLKYHTIGTWFRLLAHEVLAQTISNVLYMDSDIVVLTNLGKLWNDYAHKTKWLQMGTSAGFIILNVQKLPEMWEAVDNFGLDRAQQILTEQSEDSSAYSIADQLFLKTVALSRPDMTDTLDPVWDNTMASTLWKWKKRLVEKRPQIGYIHFNGGGNGKESWFGGDKRLDDESYQPTIQNKYLVSEDTKASFGIADYYIRLNWSWARFFAISAIAKSSPVYDIVIQHGKV